jgi:glycine cleavage system aminomethyltransferase T
VAELLARQPEVKPIGLGRTRLTAARAGLPLYGHDLDEQTTPIEADLGFAISKRRRAEGGFPGARASSTSWKRHDQPPRRPDGRRAASRFAKARWSSTAKATKSDG